MNSINCILLDELLEHILSYLPVASIFRASCVCKKWREIVTSKRFCLTLADAVTQKPWYFMFTRSEEPLGYAYDPTLRKWYGIDLPCFVTSNCFIASSSGLVCFMNNDKGSQLYVCNPITECCTSLLEPPDLMQSDYSALAVSVDSASQAYTLAIVKSKQEPEYFHQWDLSIHVYDSGTGKWSRRFLNGWRTGDASVMCNGVLYFLIYATGGGIGDTRHGLI